ncbi:L-pipecolate oxidase [Phialemonium atrogriseum]|uniref:L-pipecolate oxidase n=1 Tax=Phialemonium atrogriseum TaxID=1093897 RepID=A0AAJ0BVF5_9PEZI|nr:L-pipecolate oxidase [Phialemonium atrogriseum]KAK1763777.1 L-pipecolate oxidase [Phialemonium atrogriseum]
MAPSKPSYLIVGAGVFGVSTAYHLIQKYPDASVTLVDRDAFDADSRVAASWDWNKVVRADYDDFVYCQLALEAQDVFKTNPLWKPYFHQTGVYWTCRSDYATNVIAHHHKLGRKDDIIALPVSEARKLYNGLFDDADYSGVKEVLVNKASGWAAAGDCLRAITRKALDLGVKYVTAETAWLQTDGRGSCTGIKTATGDVLTASHVILCTGAYTPKLLELSAAKIGLPNLRAGDRILSAGIATGMAQLDEKEYEKYVNMPVGFQGYTAQHGKPFIGTLPPTKDRELKWWGSKIFSNTQEVLPGCSVSAPPAEKDYAQWKVPRLLKNDVAESRNEWYGRKSADWNMTKHRICWDAFTTSSDFIISPHTTLKGLYVATCGSFHGFKFFPVLGKYVIQMLEVMPPPEEDLISISPRGRRRSHHACLTCRRKKTRCPGERPKCSSCVRLKQSCSYPAIKESQRRRSDERLQQLEEKLDILLSGGSLPNRPVRQGPSYDEVTDTSGRSYSATPPAREPSYPANNPSAVVFDPESGNLRLGRSNMATGISLYFKYCHRQPIWCFEREELGDYGSIPEELASSILALTSRFSEKRERDLVQLYGNNAKTLIMLRIANGTVDLTTIESLCLLSYSSFMDGNVHLGQFHLGLSFQLCRSAMLDIESVYAIDDGTTERKKRLFWSLQLLEQFYGRQEGLLSVPTDIWRPAYSFVGGHQMGLYCKTPPLPRDELGTSTSSEPGIWNTSVHLGWVWSQVRKYVSDCAQNILKEPWRHDSTYAKVVSDFMETENRIPMCHRYDSVKFYERKVEDMKMKRDYWAPWLKEQFTYHAIPTVLNHPFLYIVGAQHNPNLGIPNTFWRRSSEQALLHATWIVRMIDMVVDKQMPLVDPFFGHVAAIAATVHLYYCCAAAPKLKHKSNTDFAKCRTFLKSFIPCSAACGALDHNLDQMTRIAAGSESMDVEDWMPSKIYLSVPLMWEILQFNSTTHSQEIPTSGLLDASLAPVFAPDDAGDSLTLEIIVATSPEITINTADGGQEAPTLSYKPPISSGAGSGSSRERQTVVDSPSAEQIDSLTFNTTPWLYADSSQLVNIGDLGYPQSEPGSGWWEGENF